MTRSTPESKGSGEAPRAVLVSVGDELLLGDTVDSNSAWLGRTLSHTGFDVVRKYAVGDDDHEIGEALGGALDVADLVVFTGGLGPTDDDRTRRAVAGWLGLPLHLDSGILAELEERFQARGIRRTPANNRGQAEVPEGGTVLRNPIGTAPGLLIDGGEGRWICLLPGVPREMRTITQGDFADRLHDLFGSRLRPVQSRLLRTTGIAESVLAERVDALTVDLGPVTVAYLPDQRGVDLRLTVRGIANQEEAGRWLDDAEESLASVVNAFRYEAPETGDLVEAVHAALVERQWCVATAESCTGGLIAKRLTDFPGASATFVGGIVAYADDVKVESLGVDRAVIERNGAVSESVAVQMARGVAESFGVECGIGITGVAGPGGGSEAKPVGTVWFAVSIGGEVTAKGERFVGDRHGIRNRSSQAALALLLSRLTQP